jgi:hypothetical protein
MIGGIEALHFWTPPGALTPAITLGAVKAPTTGVLIWPRYKLTRVSGLHSLGDPQDNRDLLVGRIGEISRLSKRRGKTVVYEGTITARNLLELRTAEQDLRAAFFDLDFEGRMDVAWHEDNAEFAAIAPKFYEARPLACEVIDEQGSAHFNRPFVLSLRMSDPRYFDEESESDVATVTNTNTIYEIEDA